MVVLGPTIKEKKRPPHHGLTVQVKERYQINKHADEEIPQCVKVL